MGFLRARFLAAALRLRVAAPFFAARLRAAFDKTFFRVFRVFFLAIVFLLVRVVEAETFFLRTFFFGFAAFLRLVTLFRVVVAPA